MRIWKTVLLGHDSVAEAGGGHGWKKARKRVVLGGQIWESRGREIVAGRKTERKSHTRRTESASLLSVDRGVVAATLSFTCTVSRFCFPILREGQGTHQAMRS